MHIGMGIARIKMAHYTQEKCKKTIANIRKAVDNYSKRLGRVFPLAIALDLKGPEIRTGSFKDVRI